MCVYIPNTLFFEDFIKEDYETMRHIFTLIINIISIKIVGRIREKN